MVCDKKSRFPNGGQESRNSRDTLFNPLLHLGGCLFDFATKNRFASRVVICLQTGPKEGSNGLKELDIAIGISTGDSLEA